VRFWIHTGTPTANIICASCRDGVRYDVTIVESFDTEKHVGIVTSAVNYCLSHLYLIVLNFSNRLYYLLCMYLGNYMKISDCKSHRFVDKYKNQENEEKYIFVKDIYFSQNVVCEKCYKSINVSDSKRGHQKSKLHFICLFYVSLISLTDYANVTEF